MSLSTAIAQIRFLLVLTHYELVHTQMKTVIFDNSVKFNECIIRWACTLNFPIESLVSIPFWLIIRFLPSSLAITACTLFIYLFCISVRLMSKWTFRTVTFNVLPVEKWLRTFSHCRNSNFLHDFEHSKTNWKTNEENSIN